MTRSWPRIKETVEKLVAAGALETVLTSDETLQCKVYETAFEANLINYIMSAGLVPILEYFLGLGPDSRFLWGLYLDPAISQRVYRYGPGQPLSDEFRDASGSAAANFRQAVFGQLRSGVVAPSEGLVFVLPAELNLGGTAEPDISYPAAGDQPGNLAGGVGESKFGPDSRSFLDSAVSVEFKIDEDNRVESALAEVQPHLLMTDALDFCLDDGTISGALGTDVEKPATIALSRLEVMGYTEPVQLIVESEFNPFSSILRQSTNRPRRRWHRRRRRSTRVPTESRLRQRWAT